MTVCGGITSETSSDSITAGLGWFHQSSSFINVAIKGELGSDPQIWRGEVPSEGDGHIVATETICSVM